MTEIKSYRNKDLLNRLSEMQQAHYYATACHTLVRAEQAIVNLENEIAELRAALAKLAQGKPVATIQGDDKSRHFQWRKDIAAFDYPIGTPVFTHPVRPMSDADAQLMWDEACKDTPQKPGWCRHIRYARMVEAHIKGATE